MAAAQALNKNNAVIIIHGENNRDTTIAVQYNPPEYSMEYSVSYAKPKNTDAGGKEEFIGIESTGLSLSLTVDGFSEAGTMDESKAADVSDYVKKLQRLVTIDEKLHRPPECTFNWGTVTMRGQVKKLNARYTMFSSAGKPIRAVIEISLSSSEKKPLPLQSPDRTKRRVLEQGTQLYLLAQQAYQDPGKWREIAVANRIKNPRRIEAGTMLSIPPLEDRP